LQPDDQILFRRLAAFAGGATFEAIEAVVNFDGSRDVFGGLERLLEQSLLRQEEDPGGEPRFTMLETIREFGLEQLESSGEAEETRRRHAMFFLAVAEQAEPALIGSEQGVWLDRLEVEHDNFRSALAWADAHEPAVAVRLAAALGRFWDVRGHLREGQAWLNAAAAHWKAVPDSLRARAMGRAATLAWRRGDYETAAALDEAAFHMAEGSGAAADAASALVDFGLVELNRGDPVRAAELLDDGLARYRVIGDAWGTAMALNCRAEVARVMGEHARVMGEHARALDAYEEALALFRQLGDRWSTAMSLNNLADAARQQGEPSRGRGA
jgi:tetratricopeptide (TPR) repeat protein